MEINFSVDQDTHILIFKFLFSLTIGLLIGLEREHRTKQETFAGIRTFPLISVLGTLSALIYEEYWQGVFWVISLGIVALILINFFLEYQRDIGATTEVAILISYLLGVLIYYEHYYVSAVIAVLTTFLLALKRTLENFAKKISQDDILAILKFAIVTIVIYPLLPDKYIGPFNAFNLKNIWEVVVIVSSLDLVSYLILRWKGTKTLWLTGVVGGLISSTAVSYELAKLSRKYPSVLYSALFGIILAWLIMNFRVIFLASVVNPSIVVDISVPMVAISVGYIVYIGYIFFRYRENITEMSSQEINFTNPYEISSAIQFAAIYAVVIFLVKVLNVYYGSSGVYIASLISGVIDVDAITLSLSSMAKNGGIETSVAVKGIVLAALSNAFFKSFYVQIFGDRFVAKYIWILFLITILIGGFFLFN